MIPSPLPASPSRRGILFGGAGLSALAFAGLAAPRADALPTGPAPAGPSPLTAPVLDLKVTYGKGPIARYAVMVDQTGARSTGLAALKQLRREMFAKNPWFDGERLQTVLRRMGITTANAYADRVQWSTGLEKRALLRSLEMYANDDFSHGSLAHSPSDSREFGGQYRESESIAWGYSSLESAILKGWGYGELEALNAAKGHWKSGNGHLYQLLNPKYRSYGMSRIDKYGTCLANSRTSEDQKGLNVRGMRTIRSAISSTNLAAFALQGPAKLTVGATGFFAAVDARGGQLEGTFTSTATQVASVAANGHVSARTAGRTTIRLAASGRTLTRALDVVAVSAPAPKPTPQRFIDVPAGMMFADDIEWLAAQGISTGWPDRTYRPLAPIARDAMAAFLYRAMGSPRFTPPARPSFRDVPRTNQFYKEIEWLASRGITTGWPDGTFRPLDPIARDAMAAFLYRAAGKPRFTVPARLSFRDVLRGTMFLKEIEWMRSTGISTGWPDGTYRPLDTVKRDAMAAFIRRAHPRLR